MEASDHALHHPPLLLVPCCSLGSGSYGHVSLALNLRSGSLVAVKTSLLGTSHELLSLKNELRILQSLHSPHVIQCLGAQLSPAANGSQPAVRNLFLEYMNGGSLADALKQSRGGLSDEKCVQRFTGSILRGLAYLHANGIVHCDIKSQNILIGSSGVKIADFGSARRLGSASELDGQLRGTPLWMAPEVAMGEEPLPSADIWSLGCTVVEMLQGKPPWGHISSLAAAVKKSGCFSQLPSLPESISAHAKDFLQKCLQRDPTKRWTAEDLLRHPFMSSMAEAREAYDRNAIEEKSWTKELASPRSTLEFFPTDCESDWEEEPAAGHLDIAPTQPPLPFTRSVVLRDGDVSLNRSSNWIVVRHNGKGCRWKPFKYEAAEKQGLQRTKGSEVSFESAEFLRNRRRRS